MSSIFMQGRRYPAVFTGEYFASGGVMRPVYQIACGEEGARRLAVPENALFTSSGKTRPVYGMAGCTDGQDLGGWRVVAIPTGKYFTSGGKLRPVYQFACCPGASSSSSSSSGSSGSSVSVSGGISVPCCPGTTIPATLFLTVTNVSGCPFSSFTVQLTYAANGFAPGWSGSTIWPGSTSTFCAIFGCLGGTFLLDVGCAPISAAQCYSLIIPAWLGGGGVSGAAVSCNPFLWTGGPFLDGSCTGGTCVESFRIES